MDRGSLEEPLFGEAVGAATGPDEVVYHANVNESQCVAEAS